MKKAILLFTAIIFATMATFSQRGSISNIEVVQRNDGTGMVDVYFDLDGDVGGYYIVMEVSFNGGTNYFPIPGNYLDGDIGPIAPGGSYQVVWDGMGSFPNRYTNHAMLKIIATAAGSINPCEGTPYVMDVDGNIYNTEQIGSQCWMKENLRTTHYRNGVDISSGMWWYNNDVGYKYKYGALYTWNVVNNGNKLCPEGWHVPSDAEWIALTNYVPTLDGQKLKSCRQQNSPLGGNCYTSTHPRWNSNSHYGDDEYGFAALPAGYRDTSGSFNRLGQRAYFWSSTQSSSTNAWSRYLYYDSDDVNRYGSHHKDYGFSVRCLKD